MDRTTEPWIDNEACSVARTLDLVGDRWSILLLREAFWGTRHFEVLQRHLGIARNVLTHRLSRLVDAGILTRERYQDRPPRHEYHLTPAGRELWPLVVTLMQWGDAHLPPPAGDRPTVVHRSCGRDDGFTLACDHCGERVGASDLEGRLPGEGRPTANDEKHADLTEEELEIQKEAPADTTGPIEGNEDAVPGD